MFGVNGKIIACSLNHPGFSNDSFSYVAGGMCMIVKELANKNFQVLVDGGFPKQPGLLQTGSDDDRRKAIASCRSSVEHGNSLFVNIFQLFRRPLPTNPKARQLLLTCAVKLFNFHTEMVERNQIATKYMN